MPSPFRDFIPEGEELNGLGDGFRDFVPAKVPPMPVAPTPEPEPTPQPTPEAPAPQSKPTPKK